MPKSTEILEFHDRPRWPDYVHPLAWAAGVLDVAGVFRFVKRGAMITSTQVYAKVDAAVGRRLIAVLTVGVLDERRWTVLASDQVGFLTAILPWLRTRTQFERASAVLRFRLTMTRQSGRLSGRLTLQEHVRRAQLMEDSKRGSSENSERDPSAKYGSAVDRAIRAAGLEPGDRS